MRNINKTSGSPRLVALMAGAALLGLVSQSAMAAGTAAGDTISNTATVGYSIGGVSQTAITSTAATFLVDAKINLTVSGGANTDVLPNATAQVSTFTVTNNSNSPLDFSLSLVSAIAGDDFDPTGCAVYVENGTTGGFQSAEDTATYIDELAKDASKSVYAVCNIPAGLVDADVANVGLVATAGGDFSGANGIYVATAGVEAGALTETAGADTAATVDLVFADDVVAGNTDDTADTGNGAGIRNAAASNRNTYTVNIVLPTITKTAVLQCDPLNGVTDPKNIPGAITQWTITVTNPVTNPDAVTLTTITDALTVAKTAMDPGKGTTALTAALNVPTDAATCVAGTGNYGFKVTVPVARQLGGSAGASATTSYFTTTTTADGIDFATPTITATFATILPVDAVNVHATAGLLKPGESVTIIFNTVLQ
jgi:hypothetical protein